MKSPILLLALIAVLALGSCTTAYKTGQTPDDVYYSPARAEEEYVSVERKNDRRYEGTEEYYDDRYLRMKVRNRYRWSELDDWYYFGNRYHYGYYYHWSNPWSPYYYWDYAYNPYYTGVIIVNPKTPTYRKPRVFNLNSYNPTEVNTKNASNPKTRGVRTIFGNQNDDRYNNTNNNRSPGGVLRNIFNSNNSSNKSSSPSTTTSNSSSGSGSSSGSSGGSAPVRKF